MTTATQLGEKLLTVKEVAEIFRHDPYTIREWLKKNLLHGQKSPTGGAWLIPQAEVDRLLSEMQERAA